MADAQYYGPPDSGQAVQGGSVGAAFAQDQTDKSPVTQTSSGSGAQINNTATAKTALGGGSGGGGSSGGGSGGGGGGGGGYSIGASLANAQTISDGFSGTVTTGARGAVGFGDFNTNFGGTQTTGISGKVLAIIAGVVAIVGAIGYFATRGKG